METMVISGKTFQYEIYHESNETRFYLGTKIKKYRKYFFFGPKIKIETPKLVFIINDNIKSNLYSKEKLRSILEKKSQINL